MGRIFQQNADAQYCHQTLGSKQITTRFYVGDDLRINVLRYQFDEILTYPSKMLDTEPGGCNYYSIDTWEFKIMCD